MATGKNAKNTQTRAENPAPAQEAGQAGQPLVFEVRINSLNPNAEDVVKGTASVNINKAFAVRGVKIMEGTNGLFISMPSYKAGNEYKDICFPVTPECRKQLNDAVLQAYEHAIMQGQNNVAKIHGMQQAPEGQPMEMAGM